MDRTVLLTGAAGGVGTWLRPYLRSRYTRIILSDRLEITDLADKECFRGGNLEDPASMSSVCENVDAIVHLGGQSIEADWDKVNQCNMQGMVTLMEEARKAGVKRVVFASSNHVIGMYSRERRIGTSVKVRPDSRYGLSKAFGEALCALYADKYGFRCLSIRIGNVEDKPVDLRRLSIWIHPDDLFQLVRIGIEHSNLHNEIVYGCSLNERGFWDNDAAFRLGYRPVHKAEDHLASALAGQAKTPIDDIGDRLQGGGFGSAEFDGDLQRTLWS